MRMYTHSRIVFLSFIFFFFFPLIVIGSECSDALTMLFNYPVEKAPVSLILNIAINSLVSGTNIPLFSTSVLPPPRLIMPNFFGGDGSSSNNNSSNNSSHHLASGSVSPYQSYKSVPTTPLSLSSTGNGGGGGGSSSIISSSESCVAAVVVWLKKSERW